MRPRDGPPWDGEEEPPGETQATASQAGVGGAPAMSDLDGSVSREQASLAGFRVCLRLPDVPSAQA